MKSENHLVIYCDGACTGNPGPGGWGAILLMGVVWKKQVAGFENPTTNNRMELSAAINSLKAAVDLHQKGELPHPLELIYVYTDSMYVRNGITDWIIKWKRNGWRDGKIKNQDLWMQLDSISKDLPIKWEWVRGHSGNVYNEMADNIARNSIKKGLNIK
jgi:ribonuclease HI